MRIYCSNPLLYLIRGTFFSIAWPVWRISFGHATVSLLSINILDQLTLVNLTRMGGCLRAPGSFPSHPWRLQAPFSCLQSPSYSLRVPFTTFQVPFFDIFCWMLDFVGPNLINCGLLALARATFLRFMMCILASFSL